jgi:hypothetical protein
MIDIIRSKHVALNDIYFVVLTAVSNNHTTAQHSAMSDLTINIPRNFSHFPVVSTQQVGYANELQNR